MAKKKIKSAAPKKAPVPEQQVNAAEVLKEKLKQANKGGVLDVLGKIKNTKPEEWKDADKVKDLAKKLATQFKLPVNEERLNQFMKAYKDATKGGQPQDPDQLLKKYGKNVDPKSIDEFKKFMK